MNIIAIGGGDKKPAVQRGLDLSDGCSRVLIVPTAASTEGAFDRKVPAALEFFEELGAAPAILHRFEETPTKTQIEHEIGRAGLIYTIGGNTPNMLKTMSEHRSDHAIEQAIRAGKVHAGTSAGALLPFKILHSNVAKHPSKEEWDFAYLNGLGIIDAAATAHADQHDPTPYGLRPDSRLEALMATFPESAQIGFGIENGAAAIFGERPEIIQARPDAVVHLIGRDATSQVVRRDAEASDLSPTP
jgi:peptidase E